MREIRFRAWFEDEMIYSDCAIGEFEFAFDVNGNMEFNTWNDEMHKLTPDGDVTYSGWDTYTTDIMQFTGLKDKNGVDIYEGDIVYWNPMVCFSMKHGEIREDIYAEIVWCEGGAGFTFRPLYGTHLRTLDMETSEVVDNVYENSTSMRGMNESR